jgi:hypothetical protein
MNEPAPLHRESFAQIGQTINPYSRPTGPDLATSMPQQDARDRQPWLKEQWRPDQVAPMRAWRIGHFRAER